jgi:four helix bundle protein
MRNDKDNLIVRKSFDFSVSIIKYCEVLIQSRKYVIANQLLRSGTSIGANIFEAQNAESKADFIHKMKSQPKKPVKHCIG